MRRVFAVFSVVLGLAACGSTTASPSPSSATPAQSSASPSPPPCSGSSVNASGTPSGAGCFQATHCALGGGVLNVQLQGQIGAASYQLTVQLNPYHGPATYATTGGTDYVLLVPSDLTDNFRSTAGSVTISTGTPHVSGVISADLQGGAGSSHLAGAFDCTVS